MEGDVINETLVFLFGPCTLVCVLFLTTWRSAHGFLCVCMFGGRERERKRENERDKEKEGIYI